MTEATDAAADVDDAERALWKARGQRVQTKRLQMDPKVSQALLAYRVGVHPQTISCLEQGTRRTSDKILLAVARELGVAPDELYAWPEAPEAPEVRAS